MEKLNMAVRYGADAVYLAGTSFGMRSFAGNFTPEALPKAVRLAHEHGVRVHVTVNTMARNDEIRALPAHLELLEDCGADALIVADLGAFRLCERYAPHCERHVSTQVSVANYATATAWYELGAKRVVLARELSLDEIATIRALAPAGLELEVFHGVDASRSVDIQGEGFSLVKQVIGQTFPGLETCPYVMTGATDARNYEAIAEHVVRFAPVIYGPEQMKGMHGINENIGIDCLPGAVDFYKHLIAANTGAAGEQE